MSILCLRLGIKLSAGFEELDLTPPNSLARINLPVPAWFCRGKHLPPPSL
jgi:hypothetical protein